MRFGWVKPGIVDGRNKGSSRKEGRTGERHGKWTIAHGATDWFVCEEEQPKTKVRNRGRSTGARRGGELREFFCQA